jgi:AraC-like DNA-binding protein
MSRVVSDAGPPDCLMAQIAELCGSPPLDHGCLKSAAGWRVGTNSASCVKCLRHRKALHEWLSLPLLDKRSDLEAYLDFPLPTARSDPGGHPAIMLTAEEERPLAFRWVLHGSSAATSPCCSAAPATDASGIREAGWHFSCLVLAGEAGGSCNQITVRHCPNRLSYFHYLPFAPERMTRPARELFVSNLTAVLGSIRAERSVFPDSRVSLSPVRAAVRTIFETRGSVQSCLKTMSRQVHLSTSYLAVIFTRVVGVCFRQYVRSVRLANAAESLVNSGNRISNISAALGYTEPSNFVRDFRCGLGVCPTKLRCSYPREGFVWPCPLKSGGAGAERRGGEHPRAFLSERSAAVA